MSGSQRAPCVDEQPADPGTPQRLSQADAAIVSSSSDFNQAQANSRPRARPAAPA